MRAARRPLPRQSSGRITMPHVSQRAPRPARIGCVRVLRSFGPCVRRRDAQRRPARRPERVQRHANRLPRDGWYNSATVIGPDGGVLGGQPKCFPTHGEIDNGVLTGHGLPRQYGKPVVGVDIAACSRRLRMRTAASWSGSPARAAAARCACRRRSPRWPNSASGSGASPAASTPGRGSSRACARRRASSRRRGHRGRSPMSRLLLPAFAGHRNLRNGPQVIILPRRDR
jgi:hypothetical protein